MKELLLSFLLFFAAMWGLGQIRLPTIIAGIGLAMALVGVLQHSPVGAVYDRARRTMDSAVTDRTYNHSVVLRTAFFISLLSR